MYYVIYGNGIDELGMICVWNMIGSLVDYWHEVWYAWKFYVWLVKHGYGMVRT